MSKPISKNANILAALSFALGLLGLYFYISRLEESLRGGAPQSVLVATHELPQGHTLRDDDLAVVEVPEGYLDERRVRAADRARALGVELDVSLNAGDGLVWSDLVAGAAHRHLAKLVKPGQRAYALKRSVNPLGTLLHVGDRVDVLLRQGDTSETLLERVVVLAMGGRLDESEAEQPSPSDVGVTLSVTPGEAKILQAADARGELLLVLRNPQDQRLSQPLGVRGDAERRSHLSMTDGVVEREALGSEVERVR